MGHPLIRPLTLAGTAAVATLMLATPRLLRLGATEQEARGPLPGDEEVPAAQVQGTRAVTIDAPPEQVWPWIAQIGYHGYGRAGWYALDLADNDGVPSAWEIIPAFQHPQVGQVIGEEGFTIRAIEPDRLLLLSYHFPRTEGSSSRACGPGSAIAAGRLCSSRCQAGGLGCSPEPATG